MTTIVDLPYEFTYYANKLSALAGDTIDSYNINPLFGEERNNTLGDIIVKSDGKDFQLYKVKSLNNLISNRLVNFYGVIQQNDNKLRLTVKFRTRMLLGYLLWFFCMISTSIFALANNSFMGFFFLLISFWSIASLYFERKRFYQFAIDFLKKM
ncbi:MAG: hypothetical protein JST70_06110 [Bacteroidetes bacterium]|nr:hypothetical protein [Bacteroidota bacterium]